VCLDQTLSAASQVARLKRQGGWYAVLRVPATLSDEDHAIALLKRTSVVVHPGHFFNFAQDGFLIVSLIAPEKEFQEGIDRVHEFFSS
jgi:alanine-synthesizing transaminase